MRLGYGLKIAAFLMTGGVALYYVAAPRITLTAPDVVELKEAINERHAAIGAWPLGTNGDGAWNGATFTTQSVTFSHADMKAIMDECRTLSTNFVRSGSWTNLVYWTAPALFQECGVGPADGTQALYTVAFRTNGTPVYSNVPTFTASTTLLWECYRLLCMMTTTARMATWDFEGSILEYSDVAWWVAPAVTNALVPKSDPDLPWWTDIFSYSVYRRHSLTNSNTDTAWLDAGRVNYAGTNRVTDAAQERVSFYTFIHQTGNSPDYFKASRRTPPFGDPNDWEYTVSPYLQQDEAALYYDTSGGVRIANLASGVVASVSIPWYSTGLWAKVSQGGSETNRFQGYGTSVNIQVTCTGVSTGWAGTAFTYDVKDRIADYHEWGADLAYSYWHNSGVTTNYVGDPEVLDNETLSFIQDPPPSLDGECTASLQAPAVINWTFTRCTNWPGL